MLLQKNLKLDLDVDSEVYFTCNLGMVLKTVNSL
jgi:hypothetical protein